MSRGFRLLLQLMCIWEAEEWPGKLVWSQQTMESCVGCKVVGYILVWLTVCVCDVLVSGYTIV